jgi:uncharacterized protein (TIGR02099 family)
MKRLGRTLEVLAWGTFFTCAAAVLVLRYGLLPHIERLRPEIVERVAAIVGRPVKIGGIEAHWLGLRPQIQLTDVRIFDAEGREALVLPSVENILSWRSAARGRLELYALHIDGPRLSVRRDADGAFYVAGIKLVPTPGEPGFSDWLFAQRDIEVSNAEIEWRDEKRGAPPLVLSALSARLNNEAGHHRLGFAARLPDNVGGKLEASADLAAPDVDDPRSWSGKVYAQLGYTDLAAWRAWLDYPVGLEHGQAAVRTWVTVAGGLPSQAIADVALADVRGSLGEGLPALELASALGRLVARRAGERYELAAHKLALTPAGGTALPPLDFDVVWQPAGGVISASVLELAPLAHLGEALPLPADLRRAALELAPRGQLAELRYEWQGPLAAPTQYRARSRFLDLGVKAREALPGFTHLAGTVEASEAGGHLQLDARGAELELPRIFPEPRLAFDVLAGELAWRREGGRFAIDVPTLTFTNAALSGNAFGSYAYDGDGPGKVDLSAVVSRADASSLPQYLPLGALMGDKARDWLVKSIRAGRASDVQVRLQGDLRAFPFTDPAQGQFLVTAHVEKGVLNYAAGWPAIDDIDAQLRFERNRIDISGKSGAILGARLHDVKVSMAELGLRAPRVLVNGQARGPTAEFLKFLQASPLRTSAGKFTAAMSAGGEGRLHLQLELPLAELAKTRVAGEYELDGNTVTLVHELAPLTQARGRIAFTESTLALRDVRAQIFGGPVAIAGGTRPSGAMEFVARGEAQPAQLGSLFDHALRRQLTGSAPYVATVTLRDGLQRVLVESSLRGVAAALPAPFEKAAGDALPLRVEYQLAERGARDRIAVSVGRVALADVRRRRDGEAMQVQRAALWFTPGSQPLRLPDRPGVLVYGSTAALDLDRWRALLAGGGASTLPVNIELKVARLDLFGKRVQNVAVRANADSAGWSAIVDADELAGQLSYRTAGSGQLIARLLHFTVPRATSDTPAASGAKPAELPAIDFVAERFNLRGKPLGRVEFTAAREGEDWRIDKLALTTSDATLQASGRWRGGATPASEVAFTLSASDAGKFLGRVGYPGMVLGGKAELAGSVRWAGEPMSLDYPSLAGELKLTAEDGQFLEIDPGIGKLISLMNLQALPRRITLDFRDVFSKGFRFDRIDAVSRVDAGTLQVNDFHMVGPTADVNMSGDVDLAHETQDLKLRVVPSLGGTAATAVAIVNPVAGVVSALAQKALKNPLGQLFAHEFAVSGSWTDPKVAKVTVEPMATEPLRP